MKELGETAAYYRLPYIFLFLGLVALAFSLFSENVAASSIIIVSPIIIFNILYIIKKPIWGMFILFTINYFLLAIVRYLHVDRVSIIIDFFMLFLLLCILFNTLFNRQYSWERIKYNPIFYLWSIWLIYTALEIFNPSGMLDAWIFTRSLVYNAVIIVFLTALLVDKVKYIRIFLFLLSIFTLFAIAKALWQKTYGFDAAEWIWLMEDAGKTHLLASGTRYFSFFTDAGNFGSNMGFASVVFMIMSIYIKRKGLRIYYFIVALLACYAMFLSGTRGAMIVPLAGMAMYILLNKNVSRIIGGVILLSAVYCFFTFTYIGESNQQIRRMRTAFNPTEDASYLVRKRNQATLATYMKNKPFGEGLGLAGVSGRQYSYRFTTIIPTDSHYVSIWVQCGIVGLLLQIGILLFVIIYSGYIIMFRIQDNELKGILTAMNCGVFGLMLSAYGNNFFSQFPTGMIIYMCQTFLVLGEYYDKEINNNKLIQTQTIES